MTKTIFNKIGVIMLNKGKRKKTFLIVLFIFVFYQSVNNVGLAQSGILMYVFGTVKDIYSNKPLKDIGITLFSYVKGEPKYVFSGKSDSNGYYKIDYLESGDYTFSIEIPGYGSPYVNKIGGMLDGVNTTSSKNIYEIRILDGKNMNLNILLGKNPSFDVRREELFNGKIINFTLIYAPYFEMTKSVNDMQSKQTASAEEACPGLTLNENHAEEIVGETDADVLTDGISEKDALFDYQISIPVMDLIRCENGLCVFENVAANANASIKRHSNEWYKNRYPNYSNTKLASLINCLLEHEKTHGSLFNGIVKEEWCNLLKNLKKIPPTNCNCKNDKNKFRYGDYCRDYFNLIKNIYAMNIQQRVHGTESEAKRTQNNCNNK
jgi:hypothetical protein